MPNKLITLKKISTGGTLIIAGKSAKDVIKAKGLDPSDWEEVIEEPGSEEEPIGDTKNHGGP